MIQEILDEFDNALEKIDERQIASAIRKELPEIPDPNPSTELLAELMAFDFCENYPDSAPNWGTYYGPMFTGSDEDGTYTEYPSLTRVNDGILNHWVVRANESKHPVLKARYADLAWDLTRPATNSRPDVSMAHISIDSILEIAEKDLHNREVTVKFKLQRALNLAVSLSDTKRIENVRDTIIDYETKIGDDNKPGLWGFSFDFLVLNDKVRLAADQEAKIIEQLEERLTRTTDSVEPAGYPLGVEESAIRLASYHRRHNKHDEMKKVLVKYAEAYKRAATTANPLQASGWLQMAHSVLTEYGLSEEANQIVLLLQKLGPDVSAELKPISFSVEISESEMKQHVEQMMGSDLEETLIRIAHLNIPNKKQIANQIEELAKDHPLFFLIQRQNLDSEGRPVSTVGSLDDDPDGQLVAQVSQNLSLSTIFLRPVIESLVSKFNPTVEQLTNYLYLSSVFDESNRKIVSEGLRAILENNHVVAAHTLVPQIEAAIRNLVAKSGTSIWKRNRNDGLSVKLLDELLREQVTIDTLGEDAVLYFKVLYTDQRGWNIRNRLSHGMMDYDSFTASTTDRILHSLLFLALFRERPNSEESNST